jgi:hypothetical protein
VHDRKACRFALRAKRAEISGHIYDLEKRIARQRANLANLDATIRLFSPGTRDRRKARHKPCRQMGAGVSVFWHRGDAQLMVDNWLK